MTLTVIDSGSKGNCYLLENKTECLIIELGVQFLKIQKELNFDLQKVVGCVVSHNHGDHSYAVNKALKLGLPVAMSQGCVEALGINLGQNPNLKIIKNNQKRMFGNFEIYAFDVKHDAPEPLGFVISHPDTGRTLFITDSYYCEWEFPAMHNIIIEANYCDNIIAKNVEAGKLESYRRDRTISAHMSLQTCKDLLKSTDLRHTRNILLVHLSDVNSDAVAFKKEIQSFTGVRTNIASPGLKIEFGHPF